MADVIHFPRATRAIGESYEARTLRAGLAEAERRGNNAILAETLDTPAGAETVNTVAQAALRAIDLAHIDLETAVSGSPAASGSPVHPVNSKRVITW